MGPSLWDFSAQTLNFSAQTLKFWQGEIEVVPEGVEASRVDVIELMEKLWQLKGIIYVLSAKLLEESNEQNEYPGDLQRLLDEFAIVFEIPTGLPLQRYCDHQISLINQDISVSAQPYRYPFLQKK